MRNLLLSLLVLFPMLAEAAFNYPPPLATPTTYGIVKPDGTTITVANGVITSVGGGGGGGGSVSNYNQAPLSFNSLITTNGFTNNINGQLPDIWFNGAYLGFDSAAGYPGYISAPASAFSGLMFYVTNNSGTKIVMFSITSTNVGVGPLFTATNGALIPVLAGNIIQTNGTYMNTNSVAAGGSWFFFSGDYGTGSNGVTQAKWTVSGTNFSLGGGAAGSSLTLGGTNGLTNSIVATTGSNGLLFSVGGSVNPTNVLSLTNDLTGNVMVIALGSETVLGVSTNTGNVYNKANLSTAGSNYVGGVSTITGNSTNLATSYFGVGQVASIDPSGYVMSTNYLRKWETHEADFVMWGTEAQCIGLRGAHKISLPGASTNIWRSWVIFDLGGGTNAINQPAGAILWTNTATPRGTLCYSDGTNWWAMGAP